MVSGDDTLMNVGPLFLIVCDLMRLVWSFCSGTLVFSGVHFLFYELQELVVRCMCIFFHVMDTAGKALLLPVWAGAPLGYPSFLPFQESDREYMQRAFLPQPPSFLLFPLFSWRFAASIFWRYPALLFIRSFLAWRLLSLKVQYAILPAHQGGKVQAAILVRVLGVRASAAGFSGISGK